MIAVPFGRSSTSNSRDGARLYYGWSESIEITAVSADGSASEVISHKHIPVAITAAEMAEAKKEEDPAWRQSLTEYGHYETKPAFQTFTVDEAGHVWVKLSNLEQATVAEWLILNQDSQLVGKVELPVSVSLYRIQDGHAYGIEQGGDMGPMVVVYQIMD